MQTTNTRYIYALWCPLTKQYRYIGMTNNPENRFRYHLPGGDSGDRREWILALKRRGLSPTMAVLEEVSAKEAYKIEGQWIRDMLTRGHALTNITRPGLPRTRLEETCFYLDSDLRVKLYDKAAELGLTAWELVGKLIMKEAHELAEREGWRLEPVAKEEE